MIICKQCGEKYDEIYNVCPKCGELNKKEEPQYTYDMPATMLVPYEPMPETAPAAEKKSNKTALITIISVSAVALIGVIILVFMLCSQGSNTTVDEQLSLGEKYLSEESYDEAIVAFKTAIEIEPNNPELYIKLADAYLVKDDTDNAISILNEGYEFTKDESIQTKLNDVNYSVYISAGDEALSNKKYDDAVKNYEKAIKIYPAKAEPYIGAGNAYIGKDDTDSAKTILNTGYEKTKNEKIKELLDSLESSDTAVGNGGLSDIDEYRDDMLESSDTAVGNGSSYVEYKGKTYYIKENNERRADGISSYIVKSAAAKMVERSEDGTEKELFDVTCASKFAIVNDRFYLTDATEGEKSTVYSVDMNGENREAHKQGGEILAADSERSILLYKSSESAESNFWYLDFSGDNAEIKTLSNFNGQFAGYDDGIIYYASADSEETDSDTKKVDFKLCGYSLDTAKSETYYSEALEDDYSNIEYTEVQSFQVTDDFIYASFGNREGSGNFLQKCKLVGINKSSKEVVEFSSSMTYYYYGYFYVGDGKIYFGDADSQGLVCKDATTGEAAGTAKTADVSLGEPAEIDGGYGVYLDDTDKCTMFITSEELNKIIEDKKLDLDLSDGSGNTIDIDNTALVGNWYYYSLTYSKSDPENDVGWRSAYSRMETVVYRYNTKTGTTELLYSY